MNDSSPGTATAPNADRPARPIEPFLLGALFIGLMAFVLIGFLSRQWRPEAASLHGVQLDGVIVYLLLTTAGIFIVGHVVLIWFLLKYGRGAPTTDSPVTSRRIERLWSILPVLLLAAISEVGVFVMAVPVWGEIHAAPPPEALTIRVVGKQFEWIVRYAGPDGEFGEFDPTTIRPSNPAGIKDRRSTDSPGHDDLVFINEIHVPVGRPVFIELSAWDVLHSFSIPAFRVKQDTVPGITTQSLFTPTKPGEYEIACAELCGMSHFDMRGTIIVLSTGDYAAWLAAR